MTVWKHLLDLLAAIRRPLVFVDFETSGLSGAPPVETALLVFAPWETPEQDDLTRRARAECPPGLTYAFEVRTDPLRPIDPGALAVHGIRDEDVRGVCQPYNDIGLSGYVQSFALGQAGVGGPAIWCGHNFAEADGPWARGWGYLPDDDVDFIDTMRVVRRLAKYMPYPPMMDDITEFMPGVRQPLGLPVLEVGLDPFAGSLVGAHVGLLGGRPAKEHGALADCCSTARVLCRLLELWAPLWVPSAANLSPRGAAVQAVLGDATPASRELAGIVRNLGAPPPGMLSWDGWLRDDMSDRAGPHRWAWARGKFQGQPAHRDDWVLRLPRRPTGDDRERAWCSPETAAVLTASGVAR